MQVSPINLNYRYSIDFKGKKPRKEKSFEERHQQELSLRKAAKRCSIGAAAALALIGAVINSSHEITRVDNFGNNLPKSVQENLEILGNKTASLDYAKTSTIRKGEEIYRHIGKDMNDQYNYINAEENTSLVINLKNTEMRIIGKYKGEDVDFSLFDNHNNIRSYAIWGLALLTLMSGISQESKIKQLEAALASIQDIQKNRANIPNKEQ